MSNETWPEWETVLSAAARLQRLLPDAILVGGTAAALYARHRVSTDADHVLNDLRGHFDEVLAQLESVAGWQTARVQRPVLILGSLDGIETGVRQLIRQEPLESTQIDYCGETVTVPTLPEMLRIKAILILKRNAVRDYIDFVALADHLGDKLIVDAFMDFDELYPQPNGESSLQQLQIQLGEPLPYDLEGMDLSEYKNLAPRWQQWPAVKSACIHYALLIFDLIIGCDP